MLLAPGTDYTYYRDRACDGRNELFSGPVDNLGVCKSKCDDNSQCVSFEWYSDPVLSICEGSSSCTYELSVENTGCDLYIKGK